MGFDVPILLSVYIHLMSAIVFPGAQLFSVPSYCFKVNASLVVNFQIVLSLLAILALLFVGMCWFKATEVTSLIIMITTFCKAIFFC